jgi:hypothetical protein
MSPVARTLRPLNRVAAALTLVAFLTTQPWVVCPAQCIMQGHAKAVHEASHHHARVMGCHSGNTVASQLPTPQAPDVMLPSEWAPVFPSPVIVQAPVTPAPATHLQSPPSVDPPPPRAV